MDSLADLVLQKIELYMSTCTRSKAKKTLDTVDYEERTEFSQDAGSCSVQSITVNGKYHSLPTVLHWVSLSVTLESRETLIALKVAMLQIFEDASGVPAKSAKDPHYA